MTRARIVRPPARGPGGPGMALARLWRRGGGGSGAAGTQSKKPVTLTFEWPTYTPPKQEWAEWAMRAYSGKNPHVTIEPMWNTNTEEADHHPGRGAAPGRGLVQGRALAVLRAFAPVEPLMASRKLKVEDYFAPIVDAMKWRGKMYAFPIGINTSAMFVNKGIYESPG